MYLFGVDKQGINRSGSAWTHKVDFTDLNNLKRYSKMMLTRTPDMHRVYGLHLYTQRMCEMGPIRFGEYIVDNGRLLATKKEV